jgi:hypothetical protein
MLENMMLRRVSGNRMEEVAGVYRKLQKRAAFKFGLLTKYYGYQIEENDIVGEYSSYGSVQESFWKPD